MSYPLRWDDWNYLQNGTPTQRRAYRILSDSNLVEVLRSFSPILCGTVPISIDIDGSDLDLICEAQSLDEIERTVHRAFSDYPGYTSRFTEKRGVFTWICNFEMAGVPIEVFAQPRPVTEKEAYRHMVVEARLLALAGEEARLGIIRLKEEGLKTEPAFAMYFGLRGNPYDALLDLWDASDGELLELIRNQR